jgi:hypothetical protein
MSTRSFAKTRRALMIKSEKDIKTLSRDQPQVRRLLMFKTLLSNLHCLYQTLQSICLDTNKLRSLICLPNII